ncbi:MAG: hypothetical protein K1X57_08700 [Gemmataceae bacterium]|nr:hypothetical protein [Gemmataceae bacterium]
MVEPPERIDRFRVVEYGFFAQPILPTGYVPPPDGRSSMRPVQNLAICTAEGVDGYYLLFCEPDWQYVTYSFNETLECTKRSPLVEFGQNVAAWRTTGRTRRCT